MTGSNKTYSQVSQKSFNYLLSLISRLSMNPRSPKSMLNNLVKTVEEIVFSVELNDDQDLTLFLTPNIAIEVILLYKFVIDFLLALNNFHVYRFKR